MRLQDALRQLSWIDRGRAQRSDGLQLCADRLHAFDIAVDDAGDFLFRCDRFIHTGQCHRTTGRGDGAASGSTKHGSVRQTLRQFDVLALEIAIQHVAAKLRGSFFDSVCQADGSQISASLQQSLAGDRQHSFLLGRRHAAQDIADFVEHAQRQHLGHDLNGTLGHCHPGIVTAGKALTRSRATHGRQYAGSQWREVRGGQRHGDLRRVCSQIAEQPLTELAFVVSLGHALLTSRRHIVLRSLAEVLSTVCSGHAIQRLESCRFQHRINKGLIE